MTATARRMRMGARTITTGKQLRGQLTGPGTHVGPNALLRSASYPAVSVSPSQGGGAVGPLTAVSFSVQSYMRIDGSSEFASGGICTNWAGNPTSAGASPAYVYNNHPANLGGIVPSGGMMIDGWFVPAGTYVFQFMDLSYGGCDILNSIAPSCVFRGCRARGGAVAGGFWTLSDSSYTGDLWFLFCEAGALDAADLGNSEGCIKATFSGTFTCYRNYLSLSTTMLQPGDQSGAVIDLYENYIEHSTNIGGAHLNGITFGGGQAGCRVCRNYIVAVTPDGNGNPVIDTDCISFFQDFGDYTGTGTNPDGTVGYQVIGNYMGGSGHCLYLSDAATVNNFYVVNNLVTTSVWLPGTGGAPQLGGGYYGPVTNEPTWDAVSGSMVGNHQANNLWADGPSAGTSFM